MFDEIINIFIGILILGLSFRYEYGILAHSFTLHYTILTILGSTVMYEATKRRSPSYQFDRNDTFCIFSAKPVRCRVYINY